MNAAQIRRVNAESFPHYRQGLVELLLDAVKQGASIGFMANILPSQASDYFEGVRTELEKNERLLWVVVQEEQVLASVQLSLCQKPNGLNRAEIQKLMVLKPAQRRGLGGQLISALEQAAQQQKRGLLYLDTEAGSPAETFYRSLGYINIGKLPDYACNPDGEYKPTAIYYKTLSRKTA